jgi:NitT/TauT family transport system permease protein
MAFLREVTTGQLPGAFAESAIEMLIGFAIAATVGVALGVLMSAFAVLRRALSPFVAFGNASPGVAILPVLIIWFGLGGVARVTFIALLAVWTMAINSLAGIENLDVRYREVGLVFGLRRIQMVRKVIIPGAMPYLLTGARIALAQCAVGMILSGSEIGYSGLGGLATTFGTESRTPSLMAVIFASTGLALILFGCLGVVRHFWFSWIGDLAQVRG